MNLRARILLAVGLSGAFVPVVAFRRRADAQRRLASAPTSPGLATADHSPGRPHGPATITAPWEGFHPTSAVPGPDGRYTVDLPDGQRGTLTLEPAWQRATAALLARHDLPEASVVVLDSATGRVLVYASHGPGGDLARASEPPAASVFKIVTSSALLSTGLSEDTTTCYSGGFHALTERDLVSDPRRDHECVPLSEAFARSINTVFARRALERLHPDDESSMAHAWGFGEVIPFDVPVEASAVTVPTDTLSFARTAAGFANSHLSPLHGALLAEGVALGGQLMRPWILDTVRNAHGDVVAAGGPHPWRRAVSPEIAASISHMMLRTVSDGTASAAFHDDAGRAYLDGVTVGGKTGTLNAAAPFRAYTWFVGNADGGGRRLSVAVMVANGPVWRVKASTVARQVLQIALRGHATD